MSGADSMMARITGPRYFYGDDLPERAALPAMVAKLPKANIKKLKFDPVAEVVNITDSGDDRFTFDNT